MYSQHPEIAKRWSKETPKGKKLPEKVKKNKNEDLDAFLAVVEQYLEEAKRRKKKNWSWSRNFIKHSTTGQKIAAGGVVGGTVMGAYSGGQKEWKKAKKQKRLSKFARASRVFGGASKGAVSGAIGGALTGLSVGHAIDYIGQGTKKRKKSESLEEGVFDRIKNTLSNLKSRLKASKKIYTHLEKGKGVSGRTPEEIKAFRKKASLYRNWVTAKKATPWAIGGAAALTGSGLVTAKYIKHVKREKAEMKKMSAKERSLYKKALKRRSRARRSSAATGAIIGGIGGLFLPVPISGAKSIEGVMARAGGVVAGATAAGALTGYISKMRSQPNKEDLRRKVRRKAKRYESIEDVVNSLVYEEDENEG
jgi:hypothetical protein